ncbi:hypothetical protein C0993_007633 [Termitomyces sp. T159_Od127]|nr:hypothetical protein C0993_007633 [Termitomyces sp. T159_Od127]
MAGTARGAAMPAAPKALMSGAKGLASPVKKLSPTKLAPKCRECQASRYKAPMQQEFNKKELVPLLVLR